MYREIIVGFFDICNIIIIWYELRERNSASKIELMKIKDIGEAKATAIINERNKGKFKSFEDFQRVKGVGEKMALKVKNSTKS